MHRSYTFNRFEFHDYGASHYHVKTIATIEFESFVKRLVEVAPTQKVSAASEFITEALEVCGLQRDRSEGAMHFDRGTGASHVCYSPRLPRRLRASRVHR
jgi:hypothetical protein